MSLAYSLNFTGEQIPDSKTTKFVQGVPYFCVPSHTPVPVQAIYPKAKKSGVALPIGNTLLNTFI